MTRLYAIDGLKPDLPGEGGCWIAPDARVIGDVRIGEMASIWFGAVLRGDNEPLVIGPESNVQDNSVLHTDPGYPLSIGRGCTIGHKVMLHGCTIGDHSLVGIGATILNGATIGENCLIGAHTLVPEGKTIPANSLVVGTPGRVVRELGADDRAALVESAAIYVRNWQRYARTLEPLD